MAAASVVIARAWFAWVAIGGGTVVPWLIVVEGKAPFTLSSKWVGKEGGEGSNGQDQQDYVLITN